MFLAFFNLKTLMIIMFFTFISMTSIAEEKTASKSDLGSLKKVIKNDLLEEELAKQKKIKAQKKIIKEQKSVSKYNTPNNDIWSFMSEYWLVKNAPELKWDFKKPDYGIEDSFKNFLESLGYYDKKFKVLLLDSANVTHFSLPSNKGEHIFLLSVPFIRTMDLTKLEISILLFEDYIRNEMGFFKNFVNKKDLQKIKGKNFFKKKLDLKPIEAILAKYDEMIYKKGFNFNQQFGVTKKVSTILKNNMKFWNAYITLLQKIDRLVKSNSLYSSYLKLYPSPELQLDWVNPRKRN